MKNLLIAAHYLLQSLSDAWSKAWRDAKALAAGRITLAEIEDDTIQRCEACSTVHPLDEMAAGEDSYFCPSCVAKWQEVTNA